MKEPRKYKLMFYGSIAIMVIGLAVIFMFPSIFYQEKCIDLDWMDRGGRKFIIATYMVHSTGGESSDPELRGYKLKVIDANTFEELSQAEVKHNEASIYLKATSGVMPDGEVALFQIREQVMGSKGFVTKFKVDRDGKAEVIAASGLDSYIPESHDEQQGFCRMTNEYKEPYCFDLNTGSLTAKHCDWIAPTWDGQSSFFEVKPAQESTRGQIWHVNLRENVGEPKAFAGFSSTDRPMQGVDILSDLFANRNRITEEKLTWYQQHTDSMGARFTETGAGKTWTHLYMLGEKNGRSVWRHGSALDGNMGLICVNTRGELEWSISCPDPKKDYHPSDSEVLFLDDQIIVIGDKLWMVAVSNQSREESWRYPERGTL